jgi:RNA polymerase sigma factor (TIGR02999 family)
MTADAPSKGVTTRLLQAWRAGDQDALDELIPRVYDELTRIAHAAAAGERQFNNVESHALVHEAYLRLIDADVDWQSRAHFIAIAARQMRRVLLDEAKARGRGKRGGGAVPVPIDDAPVSDLASTPSADVLALAEALERLAVHDPRQAEFVDLVFFGGLTQWEISEALNVSQSTVERDLRHAKDWLRQQLES